MQLEALNFYLQDFGDALCEFKVSSSDVKVVTGEIMGIFRSLRRLQNCVDDYPWRRPETHFCGELPVVRQCNIVYDTYMDAAPLCIYRP